MPFIAIDCAQATHSTKLRRNSFDKNLLLGVAAVALIAASGAYANPLGGAVTTGSASVSTSANTTSVTQKSEDVVINWSSFNIGSGQTTQFIQPNAQAIAVNRIGGATASQILGALDANGRVVLINGNGMLFGKGAQVNVGSLIATSTDGSDSDVLSGKFTQAGKQNASVVNNGAITSASGGVVALVAPNVSNTGIVNAKLGMVALGAANKFTIDFSGDGLVSFAAQGDVNARASAINSGLLSGANVSMTAHAANGIATGIVNMSGIITAQSAQNVGGTIYLNAGNGALTTSGTLNAAGTSGGGQIETSGHAANISGHVTAGKGGIWKVDPEDLTIDSAAASSIDGALNGGTSVVEQTTSGAASGFGNQTSGSGDITVASALSWNTAATLTLDSYHSINIDAPISITGGGGLVLTTNDGGTSGDYFFNNGANVAFTEIVGGNTQGNLTINGTPFVLVNNLTQLSNAVTNNIVANIAFANSYDASADGTYSNAPVSGTFAGTFEGLGNSISNLTISAPGTDYIGLFSIVAGNGRLGDVSLVNVNISGAEDMGGFIGSTEPNASVRNVSVTGTLTSSGDYVGGLIGRVESSGTISDSHTNVALTGQNLVGGLVGAMDEGSITNSSATGSVYATSGDAGGLVGAMQGSSQIVGSFSTGSVTAGVGSAGGLAGEMDGGSILDSYSLAAVDGGTADAGGLIGDASIGTSSITDSFAAGYVNAASETGGLAGEVVGGTLSVTNSYWDKLTTGQTTSANSPDANGLTTSALQASLQTGLDLPRAASGGGAFAIVPGVTYPYLTWQVPSGIPQVLAGTVLAANGSTEVAGQSVTALVGGVETTPVAAMESGADGYYYLLLSPGTFSKSGSSIFDYVQGTAPGASYVANAIGGDSTLKIEEDEMRNKTGASSATEYSAAFEAALGGDVGLFFSIFQTEPNANFFFQDTAANFDLNSPFNSGGGTFWFYDPNGALSESGSGTITAGMLRGTTKNGVTLNGANDIATLADFSNTGSGGISLTNSDWLRVRGAVNAGSGDLSLTTTANGIVIDGVVTAGGTVALNAGGDIWQASASSITADTLTGSANGTARFQGTNLITDLGDFDINDANFLLTNGQTLTVTGTVGANVISLETTNGDLVDSGALHANVVSLASALGEVYGTGNINATVLDVTADTGIDLDGTSNNITRVKTDTTNTGPNVINTRNTSE
jgi:filamentous hemagglutinin family protein